MGNELQNEICDTETVTISKAKYNVLKAQYSELEEKVQWLMEQIHLARHQQFGFSSEKSEYRCPCSTKWSSGRTQKLLSLI